MTKLRVPIWDKLLGCLAALSFAGACASAQAQAPGRDSAVIDVSCDRACLLDFVDRYMDGLVHQDPSRVPFAEDVMFTENNVAMPIGEDGLWGAISGAHEAGLEAADPETGNAAWFGVVEEHGAPAYYAMRLKVAEREITEVETVVVRQSGLPLPFGDVDKLQHDPAFQKVLPAGERRSRERLIAVANGYFSTVELNDGTLFTPFRKDCGRLENGISTTSGGFGSAAISEGCESQFELGIFRINKRVRERRFPLVDEKRGVVVASGFFDHANWFDQYELTNGETMDAALKWPNSITLLEAFRIKDGKIHRVEAVFDYVPYYMHSPWADGDKGALPEAGITPEPASDKMGCDRGCLQGFAERYMDALVAGDPDRLKWADTVKFAENHVPMMIGDGLWGTISAKSDDPFIAADPETGNVVWMGWVAEHGQPAHYAMRLKVENRRIKTVETLAARKEQPGPFAAAKAYTPAGALGETLPEEARQSRERLIDIVDGYYSTMQQNDGTLFTRFTDDCVRVENGETVTHGDTCRVPFETGLFRPVTRVRDRRFPLVDTERGLVVALAARDRAARDDSFTTADGETREIDKAFPHSRGALDIFKIRDGRIARVESVSTYLPYFMPKPWHKERR